MFGDREKTHPPNPETRHKGLSSGPDFHELIGFFRVLHGGQQLLRLTMNAINELFIAVGHPVTLQDRFSQPAQNASLDRMKSHAEDEQGRSLPNNFVLEDKIFWLEGMFSEIRFQLQEGIEPVAVTGKDGRTFM